MAHARRKTHTPNGFGHFDIAGPDIAPLQGFYTRLFGWGGCRSRGPAAAMVATSLTFGVVVPDLEQALILAVAEGGAVVLPKTDNGWVKKAQIADPAGNVLTLIQG
ncbi:MAG: hypothetical protein ABIY37_03150 [Devosia sp.]